MNKMRVRDVMTHLVVTVRPDDPVLDVARRLLANRISGAPVLERGKVVGMISEADLVRGTALGRNRRWSSALPMSLALGGLVLDDTAAAAVVADVMTTKVVSIGPDEGVLQAAALIDRHGVRRLPVIDEGGYLVGVITRSDLVRCMARVFERDVQGVHPHLTTSEPVEEAAPSLSA